MRCRTQADFSFPIRLAAADSFLRVTDDPLGGDRTRNVNADGVSAFYVVATLHIGAMILRPPDEAGGCPTKFISDSPGCQSPVHSHSDLYFANVIQSSPLSIQVTYLLTRWRVRIIEIERSKAGRQ